ncbi:hypothetical protein ABID56_001413 [Alkalibacillus flavidus]|uniref:Uncharacterized protein n=1 Tax=Alkalibacillus flavidus TaxID=546021 RepID=A0ABV2KUQ8_9BACI
MSEFNDKQLEKQLKSFPKQEMTDEQVERMHADLMKAAATEDHKDKRRMMMRRIAIGVTSTAAVVLIAFLSMMMISNNTTQEQNMESSDEAVEQQEAETYESSANGDGPSGSADNQGDAADTNRNVSDSSDNEESGMSAQSEDTEESTTQDSPENFIIDRSVQIIEQLANENYEAVAEHVHDEQGVLFSPYVNVSDDDLVFNAEEVATFASSEETYNWGNQDGSGKPIELTPMEYHNEYLFQKDYTSYDERHVNEFKERGNTINNIEDEFPDAYVVEYYVEGSDEYEGMDWYAINLVFEQNNNGEWKLVAIVNDQWTI